MPDPTAALASELGVLAFKRGYAEWSEGDRDAEDGLAAHVLTALDELRCRERIAGLTGQPRPIPPARRVTPQPFRLG